MKPRPALPGFLSRRFLLSLALSLLACYCAQMTAQADLSPSFSV